MTTTTMLAAILDSAPGGLRVERIPSPAPGPGEVLVSEAVPLLMVGSGVEFEKRGEPELKGVPGTWKLYAVAG